MTDTNVPLGRTRFHECLKCTWYRGNVKKMKKGHHKVYECLFGSCIYTEEQRQTGLIKYNFVERRFLKFLIGKNICKLCLKVLESL